MSFIEDMLLHLSTSGVATSSESFGGFLPPSPDACVAVFEYAGLPNAHALSAGAKLLEHRSVQVLSRAPKYTDARNKAESAYRAMDGARELTLNGVRYPWIEASQPPFFLGRDQNDRAQMVFNCLVTRRTT